MMITKLLSPSSVAKYAIANPINEMKQRGIVFDSVVRSFAQKAVMKDAGQVGTRRGG